MRVRQAIVLPILFSLLLCAGCTAKEGYTALTQREVAGRRLLMQAAQDTLYTGIVGNVESAELMKIEKEETREIQEVLSEITKQLKQKGGKEYLTDEQQNYLLLSFARTPYTWEQANVELVGFAPETRYYFVDVTYTTTKNIKKVVPESKLPYGSPKEAEKRQKRYTDYLEMLQSDEERYAQAKQNFEARWGSIDEILLEQQGTSLVDRLKQEDEIEGIGGLTYASLVQNSALYSGATQTVRYILTQRLNLGEEQGLKVAYLYLKDFKVDAEESKGQVVLDSTVEVLKPFLDRLIDSYHKAITSNNSQGLNTLTVNYGQADKYYAMWHKYAYSTIGNYVYEVVGRRGSFVDVKVTRVVQERAKGLDMGMPVYTEKLLYTIALDIDDKVSIFSTDLLSRKLVSEPGTLLRTKGSVSAEMLYSNTTFTEQNKKEVEEVLKKYNKVALEGDITSDAFLGLVDLGVTDESLYRIQAGIQSIPAKKRLLYIVDWGVKTNVYTNVTVREVCITENKVFDTEADIGLVLKNGVWRIVSYTRKLSVVAKKVRAGTDALSIVE